MTNNTKGCSNVLCVFLFLLFSYPIFSQVKINLPNNKHLANVGENVAIRISSTVAGQGTYEIFYDPRVPQSVIQRGNFNAASGSDAVINFTLPHAGMVFIRATQAGSDLVALAVKPLSIKPLQAEPSDFDAFWNAQKATLATVPINPQLTLLNTLPNGSRVYLLQLSGVDGRSVWGYLAVPSGAGQFPAVVTLPPFGTTPVQPDPILLTDFSEKSKAICLQLSAHNAPPNQVDPQAYAPDDVSRREAYYARYMILGVLRGIDYLFSRADFNGDLGLTGNSQGGYLSLAAAGLDNRVKAVMPINASSSEQNAMRYNRASGFPQYVQVGRNLNLDSNAVIRSMQYYDATYFTKRIRGTLMFQTGYEDDVAPAASQFAAINEHRGAAAILHLRDFAHNYPFNEYFLGRFPFFKQHLNGFLPINGFQKELLVNAGADQNLNTTTTTLTATALADGSTAGISNPRWEKVEGVGTVSFSAPNAFSTQANFSQNGTYVLKFLADHDYTINDPNEAKYYTLVDYITVNVNTVIGTNPCDNDNTPPTITNCPSTISVQTTTQTQVVNWQIPTASDSCSTPSVSSNFQSGSSFPIGTSTVIYTAADARGNRSICSFNVVVSAINPCDNDNTSPTITNCPSTISVQTTTQTQVVNWQIPTASDSCSTPSVLSNFQSGSSFPIGTSTVIYTAIDARGNRSTCSFNVVVSAANNPCSNDTQPPIFANCPANQTLTTATQSAIATWNPPSVSDNCSNPSVFPSHQPNQSFAIGTTTVSYIASDDRNNRSTCSFTITVIRTITTCDNDVTKPIFQNCPANITATATPNSAIVTWRQPTATDNCSIPSVSSNFSSGASFSIGTTTVVYTARDAKNNTNTCAFTVTVNRPTVAVKTYLVKYTNKICSGNNCSNVNWIPYGFYTEGSNGCPNEFWSPDTNTVFIVNSDNTATLRGTFRDKNWNPSQVNIKLSGRTTTRPSGSPLLEFCNRGKSSSIANGWEYYTSMSGTIQFGNSTPLSIKRRNAAFQVGTAANNQNVSLLGASGGFELSNGRVGKFGFILENSPTATTTQPTADLSIKIESSAPSFRQNSVLNYTITVKNGGQTPMTGIEIEFNMPDNFADGGTVTPSVGEWRKFCNGTGKCARWLINSLNINELATTQIPVYIPETLQAGTASTKLLTSSPTDTVAFNNQSTIIVVPQTATAALIRLKPTQRIPVVVQRIYPNPTDYEIWLEVESLYDEDILFEVFDGRGQAVQSAYRTLSAGQNRLRFDISDLAAGMYFVAPATNLGRGQPVKFLKL